MTRHSSVFPLNESNKKITANYDAVSLANSSNEDDGSIPASLKLNFSISIKFCLIAMVSVLILASVLMLTVIWITCFSDTLNEFSSSLTQTQFDKLVSFTNQTLFEFVIVSETAKQQIAISYTNVSDMDTLDKNLFAMFKSEQLLHSKLLETIKVFDVDGYGNGMILGAGRFPPFKDENRADKDTLTMCAELDTYCKPSSYVGILHSFDSSFAIGTIKKNPGKPVFTPSFTSPGISVTIIAIVNSWVGRNSSQVFDWFLYMDLSTSSISNFLKNNTRDVVPGAISFVIDRTSGYLIASSYPEISELTMFPNGTILRSTGDTFNTTDINQVYNQMVIEDPHYLDIPCNSYKFHSFTDRKTSLFRLCTANNIDWVLVFSVPQWNYIGNMIIAIIIALSGSVLIIAGGASIGIFSSIRIVKPFQNLIELFESVSRMELDSLNVKTSRFKEVGQLQQQFVLMVQRIKQYRAFIPPHLLDQLDGGDQQQEETEPSDRKPPQASFREHQSESKPSELGSAYSGYSMRKRSNKNAMFRLGFERKHVSFMMLYLDGFQIWMSQLHESEVTQLLTDVFGLIQKACKMSGAQSGNFENQFIVLSWNSATDIADHEQRVIQCCSMLMEKLIQLKNKWESKECFREHPHLLKKFEFRMSALSQECKCGNVGTQAVKTFTIVGSAVKNLKRLIKRARKLDLKIVASESLHDRCLKLNMMRFVGTNKLIKSDEFDGNTSKPELSKVFEIGEGASVNSDGKY